MPKSRIYLLLAAAVAVIAICAVAVIQLGGWPPMDLVSLTLTGQDSDTQASIALDRSELTLNDGESMVLTAAADAEMGDLRWESSDESVATVKSIGAGRAEVFWVGEGSCTITVHGQNGGADTEQSDICQVTCGKPEEIAPETLLLDKETLWLEEDASAGIAAILDVDADAWGGTVSWVSSDTSVAAITGTGSSTANVSWISEGTCTVTATVSGKDHTELTAQCVVSCAPAAPEAVFPVGTVEFNGHHYFVCMEETDWESAQKACEEMGGHLATITSAEENDFVYQLACTYSTELAFLLGGTDRDQEGTFVWITGEPFEYTNWGYLNQPDNYREYKDQDYITLLTFDQSGKYHDDSGESWGTHASEWDDKDGQNNPYICEWDY